MKDSPDEVELREMKPNEGDGFVPLIAFIGKHSTAQLRIMFYISPAFNSAVLTDDALESLVKQFRSGLQQHRTMTIAVIESQGPVS